jgi:hypothetical protein
MGGGGGRGNGREEISGVSVSEHVTPQVYSAACVASVLLMCC